MSIKNIIQQENDLQEMSPRSLANYLNNPTGQYNPYLVAGELQRKEAFAQRQMTEAPQETVVDELVAQAMPMGGMPMGRMPMPQPRPEEVMVSDTITETGIANLPAPNIGQNYAGGGIVEYDNGGSVFEDEIELGNALLEMAQEPDIVAEVGGTALLKQLGVASPYIKGMGLAGLVYSPELGSAEDPNFLAKMQGQQNFQKGGRVIRIGDKIIDYGKKKVEKIKDLYNKFKKKKTDEPTTPPKSAKAAPKADKAKKDTRTTGQKVKDKAKELYGSTSPDKGPLTRAGIAGLRGAGQSVGPLTSFAGNLLKNYGVETGLGAYGAYKTYDYFDPFGTKEKARQKKIEDDAIKAERRAIIAADKKAATAEVQAELDADKAARDRQREKEAYLALALGGAKTMAGQSPFALANIGEGLGAGVGALAAYDQNEMERMAASQAATIKANAALAEQLRSEQLEYGELRLKVKESDDYIAFEKQVKEDLDEGTIATLEEANRKLEDYILDTLGMVAPQKREYRDSKGQIFYAAE